MRVVFLIGTSWRPEVIQRRVEKETPKMFFFEGTDYPRRALKSDCFDSEIDAMEAVVRLLGFKVESAKKALN